MTFIERFPAPDLSLPQGLHTEHIEPKMCQSLLEFDASRMDMEGSGKRGSVDLRGDGCSSCLSFEGFRPPISSRVINVLPTASDSAGPRVGLRTQRKEQVMVCDAPGPQLEQQRQSRAPYLCLWFQEADGRQASCDSDHNG